MKKKLIIFFLIVILLYAAGGIFYVMYFKKSTPKKETVTSLDTIKGYSYTLKSNASGLYKKEFKVLKTNLESSNINDEEYAKSVAKLFIIDLYTISNKENKYDVGGSVFVYPDAVSNYKLNVEDTIYKYVEDNSNGNRKQDLPLVNTISVESTNKTTYKINTTSFEGYKINLTWTYQKDMGYDKKGEVILVKKDKYYYVAEKN